MQTLKSAYRMEMAIYVDDTYTACRASETLAGRLSNVRVSVRERENKSVQSVDSKRFKIDAQNASLHCKLQPATLPLLSQPWPFLQPIFSKHHTPVDEICGNATNRERAQQPTRVRTIHSIDGYRAIPTSQRSPIINTGSSYSSHRSCR